MVAVKTIFVRIVTGSSGTDQHVFLGIGGTEFYIDSDRQAVDDFKPNSDRTYWMGERPAMVPPGNVEENVLNFFKRNNPVKPYQLFTENLDKFPVYIRYSRLSTSIFGEVLGWDVKKVEVRVNPDGNTQERMYIDPAGVPGVDNPHSYKLDSKLGKFLFLKSAVIQLANNGLMISWSINTDGVISRNSNSGRLVTPKTDLVSGTFLGSNDATQKPLFVTAWRDKDKDLMLTLWEQSSGGNFTRLADSGPHGRVRLISMVGPVDRFFVTAIKDRNDDLALTSWKMNINGANSKAEKVNTITDDKVDRISAVSLFDNNVHKVVTAIRDGDEKLVLKSWAVSPTGTISKLGDSSAELKIKNLSIAHIKQNYFVTACIDKTKSLEITIWRMSPDGSFRSVETNTPFNGGFGDNEIMVSVVALDNKLVTASTLFNNQLFLASWSLSIDGDSVSMESVGSPGNQGKAHIVSLFDASLDETSRVVTAFRDSNDKLVLRNWTIDDNGKFVNPHSIETTGRIGLFDIIRINSANFVTLVDDEAE